MVYDSCYFSDRLLFMLSSYSPTGKWPQTPWKLWLARPICWRLLVHWVRLAASANFLYGRHQQGNQDGNNRDDYQ